MNKTININGIEYVGKVELVEALIESGILSVAETKASKKPSKKSTKSTSKKASAPKVLRTDKNGLQWIGTFSEAEYRQMSEKMFGKAKPGKANREAVYRACGWII